MNQWESYELTSLFNLYDDCIEKKVLYPELVKFIDLETPNIRILDFGCGTGKFMEFACHGRKLDITGCDISEEALMLAKKRVGNSGLIKVTDDFNKHYKNNFDLVFCNFVFVTYQNIYLIKKDLRLISNILRSGAKLVIADFNPVAVGIDFNTFMAGENERSYMDGEEITCKMRTIKGDEFAFIDYFWSVNTIIEVGESVGLKIISKDYITMNSNTVSPFYILSFSK